MIPPPLFNLKSQDPGGPQDRAALLPRSRHSTYVSVDLGDSGAQVQHGGDGADGEANDLAPGERLQGKGGALRAAPVFSETRLPPTPRLCARRQWDQNPAFDFPIYLSAPLSPKRDPTGPAGHAHPTGQFIFSPPITQI